MTDFVEFAQSMGVSERGAKALAHACVTKTQMDTLISNYAWATNRDSNGQTAIDPKQILQALGMDTTNTEQTMQEGYWSSPAPIQGNYMTWGQLYTTTLDGMPTVLGDGSLPMNTVMERAVTNLHESAQERGTSASGFMLNLYAKDALEAEAPEPCGTVSTSAREEELGTFDAPRFTAALPQPSGRNLG